jgi:hypothetical protein
MKQILTINGKKYELGCNIAIDKKFVHSNNPAVHLELWLLREDGTYVSWEEFKGTYLAEKVADYIRNTINGQRTIYWDYNKESNFD